MLTTNHKADATKHDINHKAVLGLLKSSGFTLRGEIDFFDFGVIFLWQDRVKVILLGL